jgi:hypothetical protein
MTASPNASLFTYPRFLALNTEGYPLAGGKLYSYQAGTLTPQATYTDATLTVPNPNPIILDAFGTAAVWLGSNAYKFNLLDVNGVQQADFPIDNVIGLNNLSATLAALASNGAGLIGYASSNIYPAGTVGAGLNNSITTASIITQTGTSFSTSGTGGAYTLTSGQAFTANAANCRLNVTFTAAGVGNPTFAVDTAPALPLVAYNSAGVPVAYLPVLNQISDVQCDGTHWIVLDAAGTPPAPVGSRSNLRGSTTGTSATSTWTVDELTLTNASGQAIKGSALSLTNTLTAGNVANGLDTGLPAYSTWYYIWAIYNANTLAFSTIASLSSTSPALPSGYTYKALISAVRTQAATNYYPLGMNQAGNRVQYKVGSTNVPNLAALQIANGPLGTVNSAWGTASISSFVPPNAESYKLCLLTCNNGSTFEACAAPSTAYSPVFTGVPLHIQAFGTGAYNSEIAEFIYESTSVALELPNNGCFAYILGYQINL